MVGTRYPSAAELEVLVTLKEHHYLTVDQVLLVTGRSSLRAAQQRLKELADAGFVAKHDRRSSDVRKPLRAAWSLTGRSKAYLEGAEMVVLPPRRPRPYTLDHVLAINDVLIRARVLAAQCPALVELLDLHHDRDLRTWTPPLSVVSDGFVHFAVVTGAGRHSFPILVEVDLGTWTAAAGRTRSPGTCGFSTASSNGCSAPMRPRWRSWWAMTPRGWPT